MRLPFSTEARAEKLERAVKVMLDRHRAIDDDTTPQDPNRKASARIERMKREAAQIRTWLAQVVLQGYSGIAVVDAAHQVIVEAQAHGTGSEQELLLPVLEACVDQFKPDTLITADAGYHSEANLAVLSARNIDALIADPGMRQRDERYADQGKHSAKPDPLHDKSAKPRKSKVFAASDFVVAEDQSHATCPAGQRKRSR